MPGPALIGALTPIVRSRWPQAALSVLSFALLVGALTRLVFVALLDNTVFPTSRIAVRYLLPAHALLLAFGVVRTAQLADAVWATVQKRRTDGPVESMPVDETSTDSGSAPRP